jgi:uncharacterized protein YciI
MPLFAVHAIDKPGALKLRLELYAAHRAYLENGERDVKVVMSGPLQSDDGEVMVGSFFLIEAPDRETVTAFTKADPFSNGVWEEIHTTRFHRRIG